MEDIGVFCSYRPGLIQWGIEEALVNVRREKKK
jgi:hypothetical protein